MSKNNNILYKSIMSNVSHSLKTILNESFIDNETEQVDINIDLNRDGLYIKFKEKLQFFLNLIFKLHDEEILPFEQNESDPLYIYLEYRDRQADEYIDIEKCWKDEKLKIINDEYLKPFYKQFAKDKRFQFVASGTFWIYKKYIDLISDVKNDSYTKEGWWAEDFSEKELYEIYIKTLGKQINT